MTEERANEIMVKTRELWGARGDIEHFDKLLKMLRDEKVSHSDIFFDAVGGAGKEIYFNNADIDIDVRREMCEAARAAMIKVVDKRAREHAQNVEQLQAEYDKL